MVTQIDFTELYEAYVAYRNITGLARNKNSRRRFFNFLGLVDMEFFPTQEWVSEAAIQKVRWLTGPHAVAMYRAWEVQYDQGQR